MSIPGAVDPAYPGYAQPMYPAPAPPPPMHQAPPPYATHTQTTVMTQPATVTVAAPPPVIMGTTVVMGASVCPNCHAQVTGNVHYEYGLFTYVAAAGICLVGLDLGCCLIPFFVDSFKDIVTRCPSCNGIMKRVNRL